jgi:hypothetical protein
MGKKTQKQEQNKTKRNANTHSFTPYPKSMVTHTQFQKKSIIQRSSNSSIQASCNSNKLINSNK